MSDSSILFSCPMVRALPDGRKTQIRRVLSLLSRFGSITEFGPCDATGYDWHFRDPQKRCHDLRAAELVECLPCAVGDRLWVREAWRPVGDPSWGARYRADLTAGARRMSDPEHLPPLAGSPSVQRRQSRWPARRNGLPM